MKDRKNRLNRLTLAQLLADATVEEIARRIPASTETVLDGVMAQTKFIMEAEIVDFVPLLVEKNIREGLIS